MNAALKRAATRLLSAFRRTVKPCAPVHYLNAPLIALEFSDDRHLALHALAKAFCGEMARAGYEPERVWEILSQLAPKSLEDLASIEGWATLSALVTGSAPVLHLKRAAPIIPEPAAGGNEWIGETAANLLEAATECRAAGDIAGLYTWGAELIAFLDWVADSGSDLAAEAVEELEELMPDTPVFVIEAAKLRRAKMGGAAWAS